MMHQEPRTLEYGHPRKRGRRPLFATTCGLLVGLAALGLWMLTFSPQGGVELSAYLFPLARLILEWLYPAQSVPAGVWFGGALLQWILIGMSVDVTRLFIRRRAAVDAAQ